MINHKPSEFEKALESRQNRKRVARLRGLNERVNKFPLFADEFKERELKERQEYFDAEPVAHDYCVTALRIAEKKGPVDYKNYFEYDYESSGIIASYHAIEYKKLALELLSFIDFISVDCRASRFHRYGPHYRADIYHSSLVDHGHDFEAWSLRAILSDNPKREMDYYYKYIHVNPGSKRNFDETMA